MSDIPQITAEQAYFISRQEVQGLKSQLLQERKLREAAEKVVEVVRNLKEFDFTCEPPYAPKELVQALEAYRATSTVPTTEAVTDTNKVSYPTPIQEKE